MLGSTSSPRLATLSLPIPEHGGAIPGTSSREVKWELDWLLTTQRDDGAVSHKVTALQFEGFVMPEAGRAAALLHGHRHGRDG